MILIKSPSHCTLTSISHLLRDITRAQKEDFYSNVTMRHWELKFSTNFYNIVKKMKDLRISIPKTVKYCGDKEDLSEEKHA